MTNNNDTPSAGDAGQKLSVRVKRLDDAIALVTGSPAFSRLAKMPRLLDSARQVLMIDGGCSEVEARAEAIEQTGVFEGSDWADPQILLPSLTTYSLRSPRMETVVIEALSELRLLAVAKGDYVHPHVSVEGRARAAGTVGHHQPECHSTPR